MFEYIPNPQQERDCVLNEIGFLAMFVSKRTASPMNCVSAKVEDSFEGVSESITMYVIQVPSNGYVVTVTYVQQAVELENKGISIQVTMQFPSNLESGKIVIASTMPVDKEGKYNPGGSEKITEFDLGDSNQSAFVTQTLKRTVEVFM